MSLPAERADVVQLRRQWRVTNKKGESKAKRRGVGYDSVQRAAAKTIGVARTSFSGEIGPKGGQKWQRGDFIDLHIQTPTNLVSTLLAVPRLDTATHQRRKNTVGNQPMDADALTLIYLPGM